MALRSQIPTRPKSLRRTEIGAEHEVGERARVEWNRFDALQLRLGLWLTPFGIWNEDHGSPTLIAVQQPTMYAYGSFTAAQQLGLQGLGTTSLGEWTLRFRATVSNGAPPGQLDLTDAKAVGGRMVLERGRGNRLVLGVSILYDHHTVTERYLVALDPRDLDPSVFEERQVRDLHSVYAGADVSWDHGNLRVRFESMAWRLDFTRGQRYPSFNTPSELGLRTPSSWVLSCYWLAAYRLPWLGFEPYLTLDVTRVDWPLGDLVVGPWAGLNVHLKPGIIVKFQGGKVFFRDVWTKGRDESRNDTAAVTGKFVLAF